MADIRITDLVDAKVFEDLEKLSQDIKGLKQQYIDAARELANGLNVKVSSYADIERLNQTVADSGRKAQAATNLLNESMGRQRDIVAQTTNTISRELAEIEKENKTKREAFEQDKSALDVAQSVIGTRDQNILRLSKLQTELKTVKEAQKSLEESVKSGTVTEGAAVARRAEYLEKQRMLKAAIQDLNNVLNNQDKQMQAAEGSYQKLSLQLEMMKKAYKSLNDEEKNSDIGRKLGEEIGNLDAHLKDLAADMGEFQRNTGNYAVANQSVKTELRELVQEIATLTIQYRNMSDEEKSSAQGQELEQKMNGLKARASELKDAFEDVNREIKSGANDTQSFSAITEGINLLISGVGGLTAASHALGIGEKDLIKIQTTLQASLAASNALTKAQTALQSESNLMVGVARLQAAAHATAVKIKTAAEGESIIVTKAATVAQAAFNAVAKANPYVLLATGIGLLVAAVVGFTKATKSETEEQKKAREEMEKSREEYEEFIDVEKRLAEAREKGIDSCSDEIAKLHVLYSVATDISRTYQEREIAIAQLQKQYPEYFKNLEKEAIMLGNAEELYDKLREAIIKNAIAKAKQDEIEEYAKKYELSCREMAKASEDLEKIMENLGYKTKTYLDKTGKEVSIYAKETTTEMDKIWQDRPESQRKMSDFNMKERERLEGFIAEAKKNQEDYQKAMKDIEKTMDNNDILHLLGLGDSNGKSSNTSTKETKEVTTKTYEEIKEVILEYTQEIIADRIALTEKGSKEEYDLTLQYIKAEQELREIEITKGYEKEREEIEKSYKNKAITEEQYTEKLIELNDARTEKVVLADQKAEKARENAMKKYTDAYIASMQEAYAEEQKVRDLSLVREVTAITEARAQQLITEEEYQQQLAEKKMQYAVQTAEKEIEMLEKVLEAEELTADKRKEVAEKLAEAKADLAKEVADAELKNTKKTEKQEDAAAKKREKNLKQYLRSATQMLGKINGLVSAIYDGQIKKIEEEQEEAEKAHDAEIERIENLEETGAISKEEAEARKRAADERSAQKQEELEKKKQDLKYKQAVWDKATSIAQAGIATALAITEALPNIVLAAIVGAMGAIEIATIIATPIATYAKGTKDKEGHPGGYALVGDAGKKEAIVYENKMWITPDKPTIINMPKGAIVYPDADRLPENVFTSGTNIPKEAVVYPKTDSIQTLVAAHDMHAIFDMPKVAAANPDAERLPEPVFMTVMPQDSKPIVIVNSDTRKIEREIKQTNTLIKQSIIMQKRIAYDAAYQNYKATRL